MSLVFGTGLRICRIKITPTPTPTISHSKASKHTYKLTHSACITRRHANSTLVYKYIKKKYKKARTMDVGAAHHSVHL